MPKVYKVLMLVENTPAPADRRVWPEATALRERGYQVSVISPKGKTKNRESFIRIDNINIYRYSVPDVGSGFLAYFWEYGVSLFMMFLLSLKVWLRDDFDVIHAANPPDLLFLIGLFYRLFGKKYIFDQHDPSPELFQVKFHRSNKLLYNFLLFLERCSYRLSHVVITSNFSQKRFALERGHCRADKVFVVRNGPDLRYHHPVTPEPELKGDRPHLLVYVGLMGMQDAVENCLYVMHELVRKRGRQDVSLLLVGNGDRYAALQALTYELHLADYVRFTGFVKYTDVARYLTVADIGLVPDTRNGMNEYCTMIKTMEYMALSKPVVAFDLPETRYSAEDAALYATPNVIEDFTDKVETLLDNEPLRLRMGKIGYERVVEKLQWDVTKNNLLRAYEVLFPV